MAAVNSINWTRVAAQSVYFAQAQVQLGADTPIHFVVPTGNFGDALAAYVASRTGLLQGFRCTAAVNANDTMARLLSGQALTKGAAAPTISPAMDIQLPSNFERLFFEATSPDLAPDGRNGAVVAKAYADLAAKGEGAIPAEVAQRLAAAGFDAQRVSDHEDARRNEADAGRDRLGCLPAHRRWTRGGAPYARVMARSYRWLLRMPRSFRRR